MRHNRHGISSVAGVVALSILLVGCGVRGEPSIRESIEAELTEHAASGTAMINLGTLIDGDWTTLVLACSGTDEQIDAALGFDWKDGPDFDYLLGALLVFSDGREVETFTEFALGGPVNWCAVGEGDVSLQDVRVIDRERAVMKFTFVQPQTDPDPLYNNAEHDPFWSLDPGSVESF